MADAARVLRPGLKMPFITGYAENAVVGNGHLDPGMEVPTKPFAIDDLADRIRRLIDDRTASGPMIVSPLRVSGREPAPSHARSADSTRNARGGFDEGERASDTDESGGVIGR